MKKSLGECKKFEFKPHLLILWCLAMIVASAMAFGIPTIVVFGVLGMPVILCLCFLWPPHWTPRHKLLQNSFIVPITLAIMLSVVMTSWPLKLHFMVARQSLDSIAARLESGQKVTIPAKAGLFRFDKAEINEQGVVCLWLDWDVCVLAKTTPNKVDHQFNVWSTTKLSNNWQFVEID